MYLQQTTTPQSNSLIGIFDIPFFHLYQCFVNSYFVNFNLQETLMSFRNISNSFQKLSDSFVIKRNFQLGPIKCDYSQNNQVTHSQNKPVKETLSVINVDCQRHGDKLVKILKIEYANKIITLKDHYHIEISNNSSRLQKKEVIQESKIVQPEIIQIDDSSSVENSENDMMNMSSGIRNSLNNNEGTLITKNTNKNILRAFYQYCRRYGSPQQKQYIQQFILKNSFTNSIVLDIINHEYLCPLFQRFLRYQFDRWIEVSRIRNKECHRRRAKLFLTLIQNDHLSRTD